MSRKHYQEVAEILRDRKPIRELDESVMARSVCNAAEDALRFVAQDMALMFKRDNPRFDAGRFFDAAGFPELTATRQGLN